jgi:hypothetical protein
MSRALIQIRGDDDRKRAVEWVAKAPQETVIEFRRARRSAPQNAKMWAVLTDIATQVAWHGHWLKANDWKLMFLDSLNREVRVVPNLDNDGYVNLGRSSSSLTVEEMSGLIDLAHAFGAENGVVFNDQ